MFFPLLTTGGRHRHPDQMGLQPGPAHGALPAQVLLQTSGREGEQPDALPRPQLQVSEGPRSKVKVQLAHVLFGSFLFCAFVSGWKQLVDHQEEVEVCRSMIG